MLDFSKKMEGENERYKKDRKMKDKNKKIEFEGTSSLENII
jgi:hypothetical protein